MAGGESGQLTQSSSTALVETDDLDDEERIDQLRESIASSRRQISESFDEVRDEVREATDWRRWVEEHPMETVGIAFGIGFFVGFH